MHHTVWFLTKQTTALKKWHLMRNRSYALCGFTVAGKMKLREIWEPEICGTCYSKVKSGRNAVMVQVRAKEV